MIRAMVAAAMVIAAMVAGLSTAGCARSSDHVAPEATAVLQRDVDALRAAVAGGDRAGADGSLGMLDHDIDRLRARGQLSGAAGARVREAGDEVHRQLGLLPGPTTTSSTSTTTPPPPAKGDQGDGGD